MVFVGTGNRLKKENNSIQLAVSFTPIEELWNRCLPRSGNFGEERGKMLCKASIVEKETA